jgi:hypothetical protein
VDVDLPPLDGVLLLEGDEEDPELDGELLGADQLGEDEGDSKLLEGDVLLVELLILSVLFLISEEVLG